MARNTEAEKHLRDGLSIGNISEKMGISTGSVIQYLKTRVGDGALRLSDLYFSWSSEQREILQKAANSKYPDRQLLRENNLSRVEYDFFWSLRKSAVFRGDLYDFISTLEINIHRLVKGRLEQEYGIEEKGWWRQGIPVNIRKKCVERREDDDEPNDNPYAYTNLIELSCIIKTNWSIFEKELPKKYRDNRKLLEKDLLIMNQIRNAVMHPVKEKKWSEDDFIFVREIYHLFSELKK